MRPSASLSRPSEHAAEVMTGWVLLQTLLYQKNPEAEQLAESVQFPATEHVGEAVT